MICLITCSVYEAAYLLKQVSVKAVTKEGQFTLYVCAYEKTEFLLLLTGYGKVNVGVGLGYAVSKYDITAFIGFGDCGSVHGVDRLIGSIAIPTSIIQYDVDYEPLGYPMGVAPFMDRGTYSVDQALVNIAKQVCDEMEFPNYLGRIATGDRFVAEQKSLKQLEEELEADYVDQDSGVIAQAAISFVIPYVIVKGISNYGTGNAVNEYENYAFVVLERTCRVALELLKEMFAE